MNSRVSIGLPVFNGEAYIAAALESILNQTYADIEVVIGDNASTDDTQAICHQYARRDRRVRYHRHRSNLGAGFNHNFVFERSSGQYFRWLAHDDLCAPELIERCLVVLDEQPDVVVVYPRTRLIDADGNWLGDYEKDLPWQGETPSQRLSNLLGRPLGLSLLHKCYPIYGLMRANVLAETPLIAPYNSSDAVLLVELALRGKYVEIPEYLFSSRRHPASSLAANTTPSEVADWFKSGKGNGFPIPRTRRFLGYLGAVNRVPMPSSERLACYHILGQWLGRERTWRVIGGELKMKIREIATPRQGG